MDSILQWQSRGDVLDRTGLQHYADLYAACEDEVVVLRKLLDLGIDVVDLLPLMIPELVALENPSKRINSSEMRELIAQRLVQYKQESKGVWCYYPWRRAIVKVLSESDFVAVRTIRNRYKITKEEQDILSKKTVGIIGLSVGQSVAIPIAMERICGILKLADFDTLELSNLNRINSSLLSLGIKKVVATARQIAEIDPFLKIIVFDEGVDGENFESFLGGDSPVDLVVEECDSGVIKLLTRVLCRKRRIPVVMETSDRGLLDVERFDLEPNRVLLHGMLDERDYREGMSSEDGRALLLKTIDFSKVSERGIQSMGELGKTITNWPQLATDVLSGGASAAMATRMILLGEAVSSGRRYVDIQSVIRGDTAQSSCFRAGSERD